MASSPTGIIQPQSIDSVDSDHLTPDSSAINQPDSITTGNITSPESDSDDENDDRQDMSDRWWNTQYPTSTSKYASRHDTPERRYAYPATLQRMITDINDFTGNTESSGDVLSSHVKPSGRHLRKNPKPSTLKRDINRDVVPVAKRILLPAAAILPSVVPPWKKNKREVKLPEPASKIEIFEPPLATVRNRPSYDKISDAVRNAAIKGIDPEFNYVDERKDTEDKCYVGVHWFNLATPFKLILIRKGQSTKMTLRGAMNMYRMSLDEREDYFRIKDMQDDAEPLTHRIKDDDYQFACRFMAHRLGNEHKRLPSLLKMLQMYQGTSVVGHVIVEDHTLKVKEVPQAAPSEDSYDSEATLQDMDEEGVDEDDDHRFLSSVKC